jgi:hypothetical protein
MVTSDNLIADYIMDYIMVEEHDSMPSRKPQKHGMSWDNPRTG